MMSRADLVVFSSEFPPYLLGGLGTHVQNMTALLAQSWNLHVFVPERAGYASSDRVELSQIAITEEPDSFQFWLQYALLAAQCSKAVTQPAVLQCHDWSTALAGVAARRLLRKPLVFNVHLPQRATLSLAMENIGLLAADLVIVNSLAMRDEICARNLPIRRIEVVPNGVDPAIFRPADTWPAHDNYIFFAGRLVPQKGVDVLLRAFSILLRRLDCGLVIAGDGVLELYLKRLGRYLGIPDRVSFCHWQTGDDLVRMFQRAAVVAVPSLYEPFGIVAIEAMACARAPVVSRTGGLSEIVEHGIDGYLVEAGDHLDLARRILWLLKDNGLSVRMGEAARRKAQHYSWCSAARQTERLYHEVQYYGERWAALPEAEKELAVLAQAFNDSHRKILKELVGAGVGK